ncbi:MAG: RsmD family RNA methyltransferase [Verrucomicrobia bacterium]|nr:RsmD family RNA methyltransferase [Verrucomicrobiota bacterium]
MRISGGVARGVTLAVPKGDAVRPATDGMRQAVFSSLAARVPGATFLDLFAGSGAYGLEALSRGAAGGTFVEKNTKAAACLRQNIAAVCKSLKRDERGLNILQGDVLEWTLAAVDGVPDLVFIDPPYEIIEAVAPKVFSRLTSMLKLEADPVIVFETPGEITLKPEGWTCVKRLGGSGARQPAVSFFRASQAMT